MNQKIILSIALIAIVVLTLVSGFGFYQISEMQNQISALQTQNSELQDQVGELQDQNNELQDQNSELQNQISQHGKIDTVRDLQITDFEWVGGYHSLGQVNLFQQFSVTIENMGYHDVSGLTLSVELLTVDEYAKQVDILRAGQSVTIKGSVTVGDLRSYRRTGVVVITLTLGNVLLDQWRRNLEGSF